MLTGLLLPLILATTITTGDSYSKSTVINEVEGGNVYTKIEVEANGEKKVLESSEPGEHILEIKSADSSSISSSTSSFQIESTSSANIDVESEIEDEVQNLQEESKNFWQKIIDFLTGLFQRF